MFFKPRADTETTILPSPPYVVVPSGDFDGNDGKWSTFTINIGDVDTGRGQNFKVLISTSSPLTLVPQQSDWCDSKDCAKQRGIEIFNGKQPLGFEPESSKAWKEEGLYSLPMPDWWSGTGVNGTWGSDNVGLGESSPDSKILGSQWVVEYDSEDFFMGSFGLAAGSVNPGSGPKSPFLTNFAAFNNSPSTSYGYTAGAIYRNNNKGILGNLVLGGFDQSRFSQLGTSISMPSTSNNTLVVGVQSILYHPDRDKVANDYSFTASTSGFSATIDSTLPYLWLPGHICDEFALRFQLTFDKTREMYTVNDTAHQYNLDQNAIVNFKIGDGPQDSNDATTISLPYAAFDLQGDSPLFPNATNYFPIKRSKNGIFVLGRTFLQEAYIVVDYERANFTVAPANYSDPMPAAQIVPIFKKDYIPPTASSTSTSTQPKKGGLAPGAVAGIVVAIVIVFLLLGLGAFFFWKKRRTPQSKEAEISEIDTMVAGTEVKHRSMSELDSDPQGKPLGGFYSNSQDQKDIVPFPPISEMESPPAELYSPPPESAQLSSVTPGSERTNGDYFSKPRRRGATRESSGNNTPGTPGIAPIHELPGDDGHPTPGSPTHNRGPSDTSLQTNIDEVIAGPRPEAGAGADATRQGLERRPSHARGASDTTVNSDTTAVSQPTPEEMESWALGGENEPRRPLSE
ncbi:acid protease [Melanomma pulvis-pyrius CBS 109.77]|uniref:Acid protease n=1 Tax=Melanomma pulvis-pyrius CBS 109.77 TaxID=1314802 RepID=A0A6A6WPF5_9PLEO|nr:acid protease [Melanomma pulvis-pyrius CBS 109.77]